MPSKRRIKGTTYRLVHRSYEDKEYEEGTNVVWIKEDELRRNHRDTKRQPPATTSANEFVSERESCRRPRFECMGATADDEFDDEEYESCDDDDEMCELFDDGEGDDVPAVASLSPHGRGVTCDAYTDTLQREWGGGDHSWVGGKKPRALLSPEEVEAEKIRETEKYLHARNMLMHHDEDGVGDDDKLFEDEMECEVTDDFMRQLVLGGDVSGHDDDKEDEIHCKEEEDGEIWRLLTDEEKAAVTAAKERGTARRRHVMPDAMEALPADGIAYPAHDVTKRALDRQFTEMMREFNVDAGLNDAYTDDPRAHGALSMDQYLGALEEFVVDRAGVNLETAEPRKNKGLIQQLKYLTHRAGVFDMDQKGGVFKTTTLPDKHAIFVEEYRQETEAIHRQARERMREKALAEQKAGETMALAASSLLSNPDQNPNVFDVDESDEEEFVTREIKIKADRVDCETVVSTYSTYFNQPNVIKAPSSRKPLAARRCHTRRSDPTEEGDFPPCRVKAAEQGDGVTTSSSSACRVNGSQTSAVVLERRKDETKDEKKLRRQAVKQLQRERRMEKSALRQIYKDVATDEEKRFATSKASRRTVHFL